ncbi:MAG: hypothetical protein LBD21_00125 [Tannerellaceae bacterium]|jgi:hypothetical protein|nr:hypothetical protein [Tannerellaceae bacterium]
MKKLKKEQKVKRVKLPRIHRVSLMLNEEEHKAIACYLKKYKILNKSRWYREIILQHVIKTLVDDYPTLFKENEMR